MSSIGNQISFNNQIYNVDKNNNTPNQASVRENFAQKLGDASADGRITNEEKAELQTLSQNGTTAEKVIVMNISKAASAVFDPDANGSMAPVEVSFGTPSTTQTNPTEKPASTETPTTTSNSGFVVSVDGEEFQVSDRVGRNMARFIEDGKVDATEYARLGEFAQGNGDRALNETLGDIASANNGNSRENIIVRRPDGQSITRQVKVETEVRPEGRGGGSPTVGNILGNLTQSVLGGINDAVDPNNPNGLRGAVRDAGSGAIRDGLGLPNGGTTPPRTTPTLPTLPSTTKKD